MTEQKTEQEILQEITPEGKELARQTAQAAAALAAALKAQQAFAEQHRSKFGLMGFHRKFQIPYPMRSILLRPPLESPNNVLNECVSQFKIDWGEPLNPTTGGIGGRGKS